MAKTRAHIYVSGFVQGVFFRQNTKRQAKNRGVMGWAKNLPDGRVEAVFEGEAADVAALVEYCHRGPYSARVEKVDVAYEDYQGEFDGFDIVH
ncbi:MAG: acylphosphatase [Candidatus Bathyarchaeota archaeon]|nr:acylphosphatase [Candidatus Bathyarchaeota archaeon]